MHVHMCACMPTQTCSSLIRCFSSYFQNKKAHGLTVKKRLWLEQLKGESWNTGQCSSDDSQVGQVFFYVVAVQLLRIKRHRCPRPILGILVRGKRYKLYK